MVAGLLLAGGEVVDPAQGVRGRLVAPFVMEEGDFELRDADGNTLRGRLSLVPHLTIKDGQVWWRRAA